MKALGGLVALALAGCTAAPAREAAGLPGRPTIVSLNPCTDAILAAVADPGQVLAISHYSHDPAASSMDVATARRFRATSGSLEEVLALRPDVVVDSTFTPPASRNALARLGLRLEQFGIAATVPDSIAQVRRLAVLAGHPARGEALVARIEAAMRASRAPAGPPPPALIWQGGGIVAGEGTLISALMAHAGFANAAGPRGLTQASHLPLEDMIARPPRVIFAATRGEAGAETGSGDRLLSHPALARLPGATRAPLDPALVWCGGPTIPKALDRFARVRRSVST